MRPALAEYSGDTHMDDVGDKIRTFILTDLRADLNITHLADDEPLIESGIIDSLGILKILAFLEESLGLDLASDEVRMDTFRTVRTIRDMVVRQQRSGG
jgi:acyl carrier protein